MVRFIARGKVSLYLVARQSITGSIPVRAAHSFIGKTAIQEENSCQFHDNTKMNAQTVVGFLRGKINQAKAAGITAEAAITLESLERLVGQLETDIKANPALDLTSSVVAQLQLQSATDLAVYRAEVDGRLEVFKSVITSATLAIKSLTLVNGGSAVALLAFIGHPATKGDGTGGVVGRLATPLIYFVAGAGGAALTAAWVCLGQKSYSGRWLKTGHFFVFLSILSGLASLAAFFVGTALAYPIFRAM
jgi:hypothetical protein